MSSDNALETLMDRIPPDVAATFTEAQRAALYSAVKPVSWRRHPINIRLTIPFVGRRFFLTVVGGVERRSKERRVREHRMFPLPTLGNVLFLLGVAGTFVAVTVAGMVLFSNLVQF